MRGGLVSTCMRRLFVAVAALLLLAGAAVGGYVLRSPAVKAADARAQSAVRDAEELRSAAEGLRSVLQACVEALDLHVEAEELEAEFRGELAVHDAFSQGLFASTPNQRRAQARKVESIAEEENETEADLDRRAEECNPEYEGPQLGGRIGN